MDMDRIDELARRGEMDPIACAIRLKAARLAVGLTQKEIAEALARRTQTISNMENGLSFPSFEVMRYFYRRHHIGFDFFMVGDAANIPVGVIGNLLAALEEASNGMDQKLRSDRGRSATPSGQN